MDGGEFSKGHNYSISKTAGIIKASILTWWDATTATLQREAERYLEAEKGSSVPLQCHAELQIKYLNFEFPTDRAQCFQSDYTSS